MDANKDKIDHGGTESPETFNILPESLAPWSLCLCGESLHYSCPFVFIRGYFYPRISVFIRGLNSLYFRLSVYG
jgi:hypothetical protein